MAQKKQYVLRGRVDGNFYKADRQEEFEAVSDDEAKKFARRIVNNAMFPVWTRAKLYELRELPGGDFVKQ